MAQAINRTNVTATAMTSRIGRTLLTNASRNDSQTVLGIRRQRSGKPDAELIGQVLPASASVADKAPTTAPFALLSSITAADNAMSVGGWFDEGLNRKSLPVRFVATTFRKTRPLPKMMSVFAPSCTICRSVKSCAPATPVRSILSLCLAKSVIVSVPSPLANLKTSDPEPPVSVSSPTPPASTSSPPLPTRKSLPSPPSIISLPLRPMRLSLPSSPKRMLLPLRPVTLSLPEPAKNVSSSTSWRKISNPL